MVLWRPSVQDSEEVCVHVRCSILGVSSSASCIKLHDLPRSLVRAHSLTCATEAKVLLVLCVRVLTITG